MATGADLVSWALTQRGKPYEWGAEGPDEYDCSGLIWEAAHRSGITIPRTTAGMYSSPDLATIGHDDLKPGDIVLSKWNSSGAPVTHAALWVGDGNVLEAPSEGQNVKLTPYTSNYQAHTVTYKRIPAANGAVPSGSGDPDTTGAFLAGLSTMPGFGWIPRPSTLTEAMGNVGSAAGSIAKSAGSLAKGADLLVQAFTPGNMLRGIVGSFGLMFLLIGIWFLAREVRESQG